MPKKLLAVAVTQSAVKTPMKKLKIGDSLFSMNENGR
jgi:hypothetical protein